MNGVDKREDAAAGPGSVNLDLLAPCPREAGDKQWGREGGGGREGGQKAYFFGLFQILLDNILSILALK